MITLRPCSPTARVLVDKNDLLFRRPARLVGVHDGDTISVVIDISKKGKKDAEGISKFNVRLEGIDTPETTSAYPSVKSRAFEARNRLISILTRGKVAFDNVHDDGSPVTRRDINLKLCEEVHMVFLECRNMDKYGRVLATVYLDERTSKSANQIMLDEGIAKKYSGRTKIIW